MAEYDKMIAENKVKKEKIELHKLLNHENEIIQDGANGECQKYPKMDEKGCKRCIEGNVDWYVDCLFVWLLMINRVILICFLVI